MILSSLYSLSDFEGDHPNRTKNYRFKYGPDHPIVVDKHQ